MISAILHETPIYVWLLLAALLALGYSRSRARTVARSRLLMLPGVLLALGLYKLAPVFVAVPLAALAWAAGLLAFVQLGRSLPLPAGATWHAAQRQFAVPGSWMPLALIGANYSLHYGYGVALALHPAWQRDAAVLLPMAALYGAINGLLLGRTLGLFTLLRPAQALARHD